MSFSNYSSQENKNYPQPRRIQSSHTIGGVPKEINFNGDGNGNGNGNGDIVSYEVGKNKENVLNLDEVLKYNPNLESYNYPVSQPSLPERTKRIPNLSTQNEEENSKHPLLRKTSLVFKDIPKGDLQIVKEREFTPEIQHKPTIEVPPLSLNNVQPQIEQQIEPEIEHQIDPQIQPSEQGKYLIHTDPTSVLKLPLNFRTDDHDLKILCDLINEKTDKGWQQIYSTEEITIFRKSVQNNPAIMIKSFALINGYLAEEVYEAIADVDTRKRWDGIFSEFKVLEENGKEGTEVMYMRIQSPTRFVSDRDFVQRKKKWINFPDKNSICMHFKSVRSNFAPEVKKVIRGEIIISGYYMRTVSYEPPKTFLSLISQSDIKGHIPQWLVNKVAQRAPKDWMANLVKGCSIVRQRNNVNNVNK